jgi:hypothetical protein
MMMQWCRLRRRANAWTINAGTVERCATLSTSQTLPRPGAIAQLRWRRQKASCVIGISGPINSGGQVRDTEQC